MTVEKVVRVVRETREGADFAFVGVLSCDGCAIVGIADRDVPGYSPMDKWYRFETHREAQDMADELNRASGLSPAEAFEIIASSIRSVG